jgi:hypothetical protein
MANIDPTPSIPPMQWNDDSSLTKENQSSLNNPCFASLSSITDEKSKSLVLLSLLQITHAIKNSFENGKLSINPYPFNHPSEATDYLQSIAQQTPSFGCLSLEYQNIVIEIGASWLANIKLNAALSLKEAKKQAIQKSEQLQNEIIQRHSSEGESLEFTQYLEVLQEENPHIHYDVPPPGSVHQD